MNDFDHLTAPQIDALIGKFTRALAKQQREAKAPIHPGREDAVAAFETTLGLVKKLEAVASDEQKTRLIELLNTYREPGNDPKTAD